ncbi:bifunctional adenosylcobinamide kinase/adenosylcobinamide-phosphate guanylyltransferase [Streptomyces sp. XM4193]|uniref:bifunctional adenosylcobinamide kinase/adenosylcobinamide-phosphate guanylyltransferase n=1 Tax=Streptomyces sp. XM4193 TaxID=2929782 RepID=UPI001FF74865|nr:bifunctional adenosylcobinamide kinase/adenosylcobinamide-phosphate guanylyltransferase [Streptomyces sp. XM4193]MCK1796283.1 bifunctional adenosylcobinamide kinase/adenosylcobinamide-phosphate guanylyltransferase [Streptomyces sp. XM4193]
MELTLLGTGAPDGLPRPDCPCARCALATGQHARAATAALIDGVLLLDLTPGPAFAAARVGRSLHGVRQVLLSHPRSGPPVEFPEPLPTPVRVPDGEELVLLSGHRVTALALDSPGTGYEVVGPGGERLLYLPPGGAVAGELPPGRSRTGSKPGPARGGRRDRSAGGRERAEPGTVPYDLVLLDVLGRPDGLARLRAVGAVGAETDVVAVHLDHSTPPGAETVRRLAALGAGAEPDGSTLVVGDFRAAPQIPRRTLVLGGARSGKSAEAERRLAAFPEVLYVATAGRRDGDAEWDARVRLHRDRRPASWRTVETCELLPLLAEDDPHPLLIDCLSLWLTDAMDAVDAWDDASWHGGGAHKLRQRIDELVGAVRDSRRVVVAVSNEVGSGVVPATLAGRRFRDELGRLNAAFAAECEQVLLVTAGLVQPLRG